LLLAESGSFALRLGVGMLCLASVLWRLACVLGHFGSPLSRCSLELERRERHEGLSLLGHVIVSLLRVPQAAEDAIVVHDDLIRRFGKVCVNREF
jgi:hypothetical protein